MTALGVPTTRCLAVVSSGELVQRETKLPGAIVTRVASSHIRVGTFEFFAARRDYKSVKSLCKYSIERHYPELQQDGAIPYIAFINKVIDRQIQLVVEWMRIGFIHGVMNTDNTSIAGETIDYGPCAMMGSYDPDTVYSSIDSMGRYAFGNQPKILQWNMARFVECLLPLIDGDLNKAQTLLAPIITKIPDEFEQRHLEMMAKKFGLSSYKPEDKKLITLLLNRFKEQNLDYTITFNLLTESLSSKETATQIKFQLGETYNLWQKRLLEQNTAPEEAQELMRRHNPMVIPRNHHMEAAIQECQQTGKTTLAEDFLQVLHRPYTEQKLTSRYQDPPHDDDKSYRTFCGT